MKGIVTGGRFMALVAVLACTAVFAPGAIAASDSGGTPCRTSAPRPGGEWPSYGHDLANTRSQPDENALGPDAAGQLKPAWTFSTASLGDPSGFQSTPVVDDGCVFAGSSGGVVYALDAGTGRALWHTKLDVPTAGLGGAIVGAPAVYKSVVIVLANLDGGPYAVALDKSTGAVRWRSAPVIQKAGYYTNASPVLAGDFVVVGYSSPEGDSTGQGGFALLDASTGAIVKVTPTIPPADQAKGYAGGGLWTTPAYDPSTRYLYFGAGNPNSKTVEHQNTNAILKIDLARSRPTFGQIVAAYKGNVDQYAEELQTLSHTPACAASDTPQFNYPLDDPVCGQLDLDFGASPNLFTSNGRTLVGELQKSGVYHAARADTMGPAWTALVGVSCAACNAASTAFDGSSIAGVGTPGGAMFSLNRDSGEKNWTIPIADGVHYQSTSTAAGVLYTIDGNGFLDVIRASSGETLTRRPMSQDTGAPMGGQATSSGVAIAEHTVFAAATGGPASDGSTAQQTSGFLIAYRPSD
jgi:polyvinyl alcohol dehydrogenase (cytochrome)